MSRALALAFVTGVLVVMADFERTSHLAQALAVLIMTSVLLAYGGQAIANVQGIVGSPAAPSSAGGTRKTSPTSYAA